MYLLGVFHRPGFHNSYEHACQGVPKGPPDVLPVPSDKPLLTVQGNKRAVSVYAEGNQTQKQGKGSETTFSTQIETYGSTSKAILPVSITRRSIRISATKLLPALLQDKKD